METDLTPGLARLSRALAIHPLARDAFITACSDVITFDDIRYFRRPKETVMNVAPEPAAGSDTYADNSDSTSDGGSSSCSDTGSNADSESDSVAAPPGYLALGCGTAMPLPVPNSSCHARPIPPSSTRTPTSIPDPQLSTDRTSVSLDGSLVLLTRSAPRCDYLLLGIPRDVFFETWPRSRRLFPASAWLPSDGAPLRGRVRAADGDSSSDSELSSSSGTSGSDKERETRPTLERLHVIGRSGGPDAPLDALHARLALAVAFLWRMSELMREEHEGCLLTGERESPGPSPKTGDHIYGRTGTMSIPKTPDIPGTPDTATANTISSPDTATSTAPTTPDTDQDCALKNHSNEPELEAETEANPVLEHPPLHLLLLYPYVKGKAGPHAFYRRVVKPLVAALPEMWGDAEAMAYDEGGEMLLQMEEGGKDMGDLKLEDEEKRIKAWKSERQGRRFGGKAAGKAKTGTGSEKVLWYEH